jgi:c-di-GMP-binding flagellar brake protein YcgR
MPELARRIAARLREFIGDRRRAKRYRARLPFCVAVVGQKATSNAQRPRSIDGHTLDISATGLALVVPAIRVGEQYLMGEDRRLEIRLVLSEATVAMQAIPVRYESLEDGSETGYLIGVQVEQMTEQDRDQYIAYVNGL